ncbi:MAG: J domain-containing protein [Candidatus Paracaedibacteraceae bacterium]|nr:J domain-containing protein [Candidatus Paracaedibacteraceae bacterium]
MTFKANPFFWQRHALEKNQYVKVCEQSGCNNGGAYPAPKRNCSQDIKKDENWYWFCLEHVREYNAAWNFYKDMSEKEIIEHWRRDISWDRPSWPLGSWQVKAATKPFLGNDQDLNMRSDPFGLFDDESIRTCEHKYAQFNSDEMKAIKLLGLSVQYSQDDLQKAYRELVKKHHPDLNGGCIQAENRIKTINLAYKLLRKKTGNI